MLIFSNVDLLALKFKLVEISQLSNEISKGSLSILFLKVAQVVT